MLRLDRCLKASKLRGHPLCAPARGDNHNAAGDRGGESESGAQPHFAFDPRGVLLCTVTWHQAVLQISMAWLRASMGASGWRRTSW